MLHPEALIFILNIVLMFMLRIFPVLRLSSISLDHLKVLRFVFPTDALSESLHKEIFGLYRFLIRVFVT